MISPSQHVTRRELRRQATLVAALLLSLIAIGILAGLAAELSRPTDKLFKTSEFYLTVLIIGLLVPLYSLSRTRYHHWAAVGLIALTTLGTFAVASVVSGPETDMGIFAYLLLAVLLSSFLLSLRVTALLAGAQLFGLIVYEYVSHLPIDMDMLGFLLMLSIVILYGTHYRNLLEADRQHDLRDAETRYRQLVERAPFIIAIQCKGDIAYINPAGVTILGGSSAADFIGQPALRFVHSGSVDTPPDPHRDVIQTKEKMIRLDGRAIDVETTVLPFNLHGEPAAQIIARDLTEQRSTEAQFHALLDAIPDLIFQLDRRGIFTSYHAPEQNLLLPPEAFLGQSIRDTLPALADQALENIARALATGTLQTYEYQMASGDRIHHYEARMSPCAEDEVVVVVRDITEWKDLAEGLRRERDLVARITETSPVAIATVNRAGQIIFANQRAEALLGLAKDQITQLTYNAPAWRITDYEGHPFPDDQLPFTRVMHTQQPVYEVGHAVEWPDGRRVLLSISGAPVMNAAGEIEEIVFSIEDVTERIRAEQTLRDREERYRSLFDNALTGFALHEIITDEVGRPVDYRFVEINRRFEQQTGLRAEDIIGKRITDVLPTIEDDLIRRYGRVALTGESIRFESYSEPLDRYFDIAAFSPRHGLFAALSLDITDRVKAQAELRDSEERYRSLFDGIDDTVIVHDLAGRILDVNEAACRRLEYSRAELRNMTLADIDEPGAFADGFATRLQQQLVAGKMSGIRGAHITRSGRQIAADVNTKVITYQGQQAVLGVTRDVTDRNRAENLLHIQHDLVLALAEIKDMNTALEQVVESARQIDEVDVSGILLIDHDSGAFRLTHHRGLLPETAAYAAYFAADSPQALSVASGEPFFCQHRDFLPDLKDEARFRDNLSALGVLPIQYDRRTVAVLVAASHVQVTFSEYVQHSLIAITAQVGAFLMRIQTETALRRSEATMQSILRAAPVGLGLVTNRIMGWTNDQFQCITGYTAQELAGMNAQLLYDNEAEYERVGQVKYGQLREGMTVGTVETQFKRKDGTRVDILLSSSPIDPADFSVGLVTSVLDITERKRTEQQLLTSEARYRMVVETQTELVVRCKLDGTRLFVNDAYCRYFDQSREQLIGSSFAALIPPAGWAAVQEKYARLSPASPAATDIHQAYKPDGSLAWQEWVDQGIFDESGQVVEIQSVGRDVTDRVQMADALRRERDRAQQYLDIAGVILVVLDTEGTIKLINHKGREILGYSEEELLGQNWFERCLPQADIESVAGYFKLAMTGETTLPEYFQNSILTRDGETRLIAWHNAPLLDAEGRVTGTLSSGEDITERERAQRELIESEARYSALINASPSAILVMQDERYIFANPAGARLLGYTHPSNVIGLKAIDTFAPASRDLVRTRMKRLASGLANPAVEVDVLRPDGSTLTIETTSVPVLLSSAPVTFIIGQDISERKAAEAAEREARALSDALRDTAASLTQTLDRQEVFERILTNIGRVIPHDAASIMLVSGREAAPVRERGYDTFGAGDIVRNIRLSAADYPVFADLFETKQVQVISDTRLDQHWKDVPSLEWVRSHITAPILIDNAIIGIINLDSATSNAFTPDHAERAALFADQAAIAIRNANLFAEVQQYVSQLEALHQITLDITAQIDLNILLDKLVENALKLVDAQAGGIYLYRSDQDVLEWSVQVGSQGAIAPLGSQLQRGEGVAGKVWETHEPLIVDDYSRWEGRSSLHEGLNFSTVISVPITWDQQLLGVFNAVADKTKRTFSERDAQLLRLFVNQAAIAIQRARIFDDLEKRVRERTIDLTVRNKVAATLSLSLDQDVILYDVLETVVDQLNIFGGAIYLLSDAEPPTLELAAANCMSAETLDWIEGILPAVSHLSPNTNGAFSTIDMPYSSSLAAMLRVPIWHQDQIAGLIILVSNHTRPWRSGDIRMLDAIGRQIAMAMHNVQLYTRVFRDEARLRTILKSVADGLLVFDQNGDLLLMNPAAEALFGFYPEESGGVFQAARRLWEWLNAQGRPQTIEFILPILPLVDPAHAPWLNQCINDRCRFKPEGEDLAWPCWLIPDGPGTDHLHHCTLYKQIPTRSLQANSADVHDSDEHVLGQVIALRDVTYFRELDELKGNFVSTVSHELRTPLSVVLLQVSTLLRYYDRISDDERRRMVSEVQAQAHILRELIEDILELSRFDARHSRPDKQWFDLVAHCHEVAASLAPAIQEKGLEMDLSRCSGLRYIHADMNQIMRVLRNLLGNAVKYTPNEGQIALVLSEAGGVMRIDVSDTGIGIAPEEQPRVFERFFRSETAAHTAPGTGLGLSITREIVELHGGSIHLTSRPGIGSTFTVLLPIDSQS